MKAYSKSFFKSHNSAGGIVTAEHLCVTAEGRL
jgi:hypothetical protein